MTREQERSGWSKRGHGEEESSPFRYSVNYTTANGARYESEIPPKHAGRGLQPPKHVMTYLELYRMGLAIAAIKASRRRRSLRMCRGWTCRPGLEL